MSHIFRIFFNIIFSVNKRLAGSDTEDPEFPKVQFPSEADCPACRVASEDESSDESSFDPVEVVSFMKARFGFDNVVLFNNETVIQSNAARLEDEDEEEEEVIVPPSKSR